MHFDHFNRTDTGILGFIGGFMVMSVLLGNLVLFLFTVIMLVTAVATMLYISKVCNPNTKQTFSKSDKAVNNDNVTFKLKVIDQ